MDNETKALIRALVCDDGQTQCDSVWRVGQAYLIRTVTNYWTGRLVLVGPQELVLEDAAWVADTGQFSNADTMGALNEIEPVVGRVVVGRGSIVDAIAWKHALPRSQK